MNRLQVLRTIIFSTVINFCFCAFATETTLIDSDWRFHQGDTNGAEQISFDDSNWDVVNVPHNWGWKEAQEGKEYYRGISWYRRKLDIGKPESGKRYFL